MAVLIPTIGSARFDSRGELRLAERLRECLEENAVVWHNLPVGPRGLHPDFILLHPNHGLLVLEVKDWRLENIVKATKTEVELVFEGDPVKKPSPFEQVRGYMFGVKNTIERDGELLHAQGPLKGHPLVPLGLGVVFPNITRKQFENSGLPEVYPPDRCIFRDEMSESVDPEAFRSRVWGMVGRRIGAPLTLPQFDRLRALLFPEVRVRQIALPFEEEVPADKAADRVMAVMDLQQEQFARGLGDGHRIVRGVAGSGKTLILAFRAEHLAHFAKKQVLVLCYANGIAGRLEAAMQERKVEDKVTVSTFHTWCYRILRTYGIPVPQEAEIPDYQGRLAESVRRVGEALDRGQIPGGQYEAVLIDEAHDFEPQWLAIAAKIVDPDKRSLMIVYDDAQAIYKGRKRPVWKQLGIEAGGRTTVLKINYRNTVQILGFAKRFAPDVLGAPGVQADNEAEVLMPEDGGRQGLEPEVRKCIDYGGEAHAIQEWFQDRRKAGYLWPQMAVLYPEHHIGQRVAEVLRRSGIPVDVARDNKNRVSPHVQAVRLLSMHSAKGLEFPCVAIAGLGALGRREGELADDVRLTYVAITRATHETFLTYSKRSPLVERLVG